jgi:16S rRNA (uracil1498-N3)-methyltransferase
VGLHLYLPGPWEGGAIAVPAATRHHVERVLRAAQHRVGYTDGAGTLGVGEYDRGVVTRGEERLVPRPRPRLRCAVAAPRPADRQRSVVEKLAELGVDELVWLRTAHGGHHPPQPRRVRVWAEGALEQSRGAWLMAVGTTASPAELASAGTVLVADPGAPPLRVPSGDVTLAVGPEGGFAPGELDVDGLVRFGLGGRILRVETAAVVAAAIVLRAWGRLGGD